MGNARPQAHGPGCCRAGIAAALLSALAACPGGSAPGGSATAIVPIEPAEPPAPRPPTSVRLVAPRRTNIDALHLTGLSDLTLDDDGMLWAVAERTRSLVRMAPDGTDVRLVPLAGVPVRLDVEGLAWLGGDRFALGTESDDPRRTSDVLLIARVVDAGARARVERSIAIDYRRWPVQPNGNQGLEGVCRAGSALVVAVESVSGSGEHRFAPVAVVSLDGRKLTPYLVRLTSLTGKLSAVSCAARRADADGIDVLAVERHFGVARLIRFELPPAADSPPAAAPVRIAPVLVADLADLLQRRENFEGLVWDGERAVSLIVDNDWARVTGPNLLVRARFSGPAPAPPPAAPAPRSPPSRPPR